MANLILTDETRIDVKNDYIIVDDTFEFTTSVADYTALAELSNKLTDENMSTIQMTDPFGSQILYSNMTMDSPRFIIVKENAFEIVVTLRIKKKPEQESQMDAVVDVAQQFDDEQALTVKSIYPQWDTLVGKTVPIYTKFNWYDVLYKTKQPDMLIQKQYQPGTVGTESLYECIDETHEGTYEDPIPYAGNMTLEAGKFYIQDNITYICTIGTGIAVYDRLEYLVAFVTPYEYATGTAEDPIKWFGGGLAIEEGKYYTQNGIIYVGIASSGIPVYGDLSSLATYVEVYVPEPVIPVGETPDHPIEYIGGIVLEKGKYYIQDEIVYFCIKSTEETVDAPLSELTDNVIVYSPDEPVEPTGDTPEDPIPYNGGIILEQGKYYTQNEVVYFCIKSTEGVVDTPLNELKDNVEVYPPAEPTGDTPEDPIPYNGGIILEKDKYYLQDEIVYFCIKSTEGVVADHLSELTDNVTVYSPEEPAEPTGDTPEDPIPWVVGSKLYKGTYYIDKEVVYLCIRDSGIELAYNLADLVSGGFVEVVEPSAEQE